MEKQPYYLSIAQREIHSRPDVSPWSFRVFASEKEIRELRTMMNTLYDAEVGTFIRAHIPAVPYHQDSDNDQYDAKLQEIYEKVYELGDDEAREYVKTQRNPL